MLVCGIHALSDACFLLCWLGKCGSAALWSVIFECMNYHEHHGYHVTPCTPWMLRYRGVPTLHLKYVHLVFEAKI